MTREMSSPVKGLLGTTEERTHHPPTPRISPAALAGSAVDVNMAYADQKSIHKMIQNCERPTSGATYRPDALATSSRFSPPTRAARPETRRVRCNVDGQER